MTRVTVAGLTLGLLLFGTGATSRSDDVTVRIVDAVTHAPLADAIVTVGDRELRSDTAGAARLENIDGKPVRLRAYGYQRMDVPREALRGPHAQIALPPFRPKALYLSMFGVASSSLRGGVLQLAGTTEINAVVIDVKGDRGLIAYRSGDPTALQVGAQKTITIKDLPGLVASLHARGLYVIARIVVFKDDPLATGRPDLAVRRRDGALFRDREGLAWSNPYDRQVWSYNIAVAVGAARSGFDEIQFDYVRLPDAQNLALGGADTIASRAAAVDGFLAEARAALRPFNVFLAADIFGYVCWNTGDTGIGQRLESMVEHIDYLSPMVYPSAYQFGIPGYRNPVAHPYEIVHLSLDEAVRRAGVSPLRLRPWLQAFPDYAFGAGNFTHGEVRQQIRAAEDAGTNGWMLWNPRNRYSASDLQPATTGGTS